MLYTPYHCTMVVVFIVKKGKGKVIAFLYSGAWEMKETCCYICLSLCLLIAVELKVRNWTKFNVRAACRPLESGQWIQTLAPDIPPTANSTATVRITCTRNDLVLAMHALLSNIIAGVACNGNKGSCP